MSRLVRVLDWGPRLQLWWRCWIVWHLRRTGNLGCGSARRRLGLLSQSSPGSRVRVLCRQIRRGLLCTDWRCAPSMRVDMPCPGTADHKQNDGGNGDRNSDLPIRLAARHRQRRGRRRSRRQSRSSLLNQLPLRNRVGLRDDLRLSRHFRFRRSREVMPGKDGFYWCGLGNGLTALFAESLSCHERSPAVSAHANRCCSRFRRSRLTCYGRFDHCRGPVPCRNVRLGHSLPATTAKPLASNDFPSTPRTVSACHFILQHFHARRGSWPLASVVSPRKMRLPARIEAPRG